MGLNKGDVPRSHAQIQNTRKPVKRQQGFHLPTPIVRTSAKRGSRDYPPTLSLGRHAPTSQNGCERGGRDPPATSSLGGHTHLLSSHHLPLLLLVVADEAPVGDASLSSFGQW